MDADASRYDIARAYVRPRARLLASSVVAGVAGGGGIAFAAVIAGWPPLRATRVAFALGALAFGGGLLGWAGSAMAGRGFEAMQDHLDAGTDWTEADSRRAMARVGAFGAGAMLATGVAEAVVLGA